MFNWFTQKIDNPIGLDISDLSVKLVQLKRRAGQGSELSAYSDVLLPPGLISHDTITNPTGLREFLRELFSNHSYHRGKVLGRSVVASVPESKAYVRVIQL